MRQQIGNYFKNFYFQFGKNWFEQVKDGAVYNLKISLFALFRVDQRGKNGSRKTVTGLLTEFSLENEVSACHCGSSNAGK